MAKTDEVLRLLLVEESLTDAEGIITSIRQTGQAIRAARHDNLDDIKQAISDSTWDIILCRDGLEEVSPISLLRLIDELGRDIPCIVLVSDLAESENYYELAPKDIVQFGDSKRLTFSLARELDSLLVRRSSRRTERALRESEKRSRLLLDSSRDAIAYVHEGMHIYVNSSYLALFGYDEIDDVEVLSILDMIPSSDHAKFKTAYRAFSEKSDSSPQLIAIQCVNAEENAFEATIEFSHAQVEGEECTQLVVREEMAEIVAGVSDEALAKVRDHDSLTGLYNRVRFMDELEKAVEQADGPSGLVYLSIDDFQEVKEQVGLAACDVVVKSLAGLLNEELAEGEFLARYSDQVFTFLINNSDDVHVEQRAETFRKIINGYSSQTNGKMLNLHCSIGLSRITESLASSSVGLERADKACLKAKNAGGNQIIRYQPALSEQGSADSSEEAAFWKERVEEGLQNKKFCLYFQPIATLNGKEEQFYDILIRIKEDDGSVTNAGQFMKHVEQTDLMMKINQWSIAEGIKVLSEHRKINPKTRFFMKLSKQIFNNPGFIEWIKQLLARYKLPGESIIFEIRETAVLENIEHAQNVIPKIKGMGCQFGLEHFGSGLDFSHSLTSLDVDYLKISGTFIKSMAKDAENQNVVKSIIEMSKEAGKLSIAEYVEDANSLALLWRLGVDYAMGYYIQMPSPDLDYDFEEDDD